MLFLLKEKDNDVTETFLETLLWSMAERRSRKCIRRIDLPPPVPSPAIHQSGPFSHLNEEGWGRFVLRLMYVSTYVAKSGSTVTRLEPFFYMRYQI